MRRLLRWLAVWRRERRERVQREKDYQAMREAVAKTAATSQHVWNGIVYDEEEWEEFKLGEGIGECTSNSEPRF